MGRLQRFVERMASRPVVGVDLGSAVLKAVQLERVADGGLVLRRCHVTPILADQPPAAACARFLAQLDRSSVKCVFGLASPDLVVRPFQFPPMPKAELRRAIHLEAEQAILNGHPASDVAIDWHLLASSKDQLHGLLAVVPKRVMAQALEPAKAAHLRPAVVDVQGLALWNAYWTLDAQQSGEPKTTLLINLGSRSTNLVIARGPQQLMLVRDEQIGLNGLGSGGGEADWIAEIRDSVGYARSQGGLRALELVVLTGGGATDSTAALLQTSLGCSTIIWNPLRHVLRDAQSPAADDASGPLLAVAVGLALRRPT